MSGVDARFISETRMINGETYQILHDGTQIKINTPLRQRLKRAAILAGLNALSYLVLTIDYRATAQANVLWSIISNASIALLTFTILKKVVEARTRWEFLGYIVGGVAGNVLGIYLTVWLLGK